MKRNRIVNLVADTALGQESPERVSVLYPHHVLIEDVPAVLRGLRTLKLIGQTGRGKSRIVKGRIALPCLGPTVQVLQLDAQHSGLKFVDSKVAADHRMKIFRLSAVHPQHAHALRQIHIIRRAQAGIAECASILTREKRKAADGAHGAESATLA